MSELGFAVYTLSVVDGEIDGEVIGMVVGLLLGATGSMLLGLIDGKSLYCKFVGYVEAFLIGNEEGIAVGDFDGNIDGGCMGAMEGSCVIGNDNGSLICGFVAAVILEKPSKLFFTATAVIAVISDPEVIPDRISAVNTL